MRVTVMALALIVAAGHLAAEETAAPLPGGGLFFDVMPVVRQGRILAPVRPVVEWAGGRVVYDQGRALIYEQGAVEPRVELAPGRPEARLSGVAYTLEIAPEIREGRLFAPLKFLADSLGVWVEPEGRIVTLRLPQLNREARLAIPPEAGSHQEKIWRQLQVYYGLPQPTPVDTTALPHWNLFSAERKRELLTEIGKDAPTILEAHWGARPVAGLRVLADAADESAGAATVQVMVKYADGAVYEDRLSFVLEPEGWRLRRQSSAQRE